jgi:hypothetical protein
MPRNMGQRVNSGAGPQGTKQMTTDIFQAHAAAEAAYQADDMNISLLNASDAAFAAYMKATATARDEWNALPKGDAKDSAETNAEDTEGTDVDQLYWYEIAIRTYEMIKDA